MAEFSENRHISNLINMSCKVSMMYRYNVCNCNVPVGLVARGDEGLMLNDI